MRRVVHRVIADVVSNHMVGAGQSKGQPGIGSWGPSEFNGTSGQESFPGVPYGPNDFNDYYCSNCDNTCSITNGDYACCADHVRVFVNATIST